MFRFFRKHTWLLVIILGLTIISFLFFMGKAPSSGGGRGGGDFGTMYGHTISAELLEQVRSEFYITYFEQTGEWPDKSRSITPFQIDQQVYSYLMMQFKAKDMGIYVDDNSAAAGADQVLRSPAIMRTFQTTQPVSADNFVKLLLEPEGLTAADFERSVRARLTINQLVDALGLPGALVTPQEAATLYDRDNQEISSEAVFFSASNYLSQTAATPVAVGQFYTNNMAAYREPDRVQVKYIVFEVSNYLAQSKAEWLKTNFDENVNSIYDKYGATEFASEKTPDAAKAKIRDLLIERRALSDAGMQANDFVKTLYGMTPVKPENLAALANQQNLPVYTTAPFGESTGPEEFDAPADFAKKAFALNSDSPYIGPIVGSDAVYVIACAGQMPSSIPSFDEIHSRVARDFENAQAISIAQHLGTNFYFTAEVQMATGKKFASIASANRLTPVVLSPFSLISSEVPELDNHAELGQLKQAAFTTQPGKISRFIPTAEGGFILYVESVLPVDQTKKTADFPKFLSEVRRSRQNEAFNLWLNSEFGRQIVTTPFYQEQQQQANQASAAR